MCENDSSLSREMGRIRTFLELQEARRQEADRQEQMRCGRLPSESQMMFFMKDIFISHAKLTEENTSLKSENISLRDEITSLEEEICRLHGTGERTEAAGSVRQSRKAGIQCGEPGPWEPEQ